MNIPITQKISCNGWLNNPIASHAYQAWLTDNGSLTRRLQTHCRDFRVLPVKSALAKPWLDEARLLGVSSGRLALVREVILMDGQLPLVFAHSVIPRTSLRGAWLGLRRLGNKPLGAVLFANPKVQRTVLSFRKLHQHDVLYQQAAKQLTTHHALSHRIQLPASLWARRSIFSLNCAKIMVTEVFLPTLLHP